MNVKSVIEKIETILDNNQELKNDEISVETYRAIITEFKNKTIDNVTQEFKNCLADIDCKYKE